MTTIRGRLLWTILPAFAALLSLGGAGIYFEWRQAILEANDALLRNRATAIAAVARSAGDRVEIDPSSRVLREFEAPEKQEKQEEGEHEDNDALFFEVWGDGQTVLARSASLQEKDLPLVTGADAVEQAVGMNITLPSGRRGRAVQVRFRPPNKATGERAASVSLMVAIDRGEMDATLDSAALILTGVGSVLLLAVGIVVPAVLRRGLAPLDALAQQASGINATSLSTRFASDGLPGELAPIGARLNDLLARLETSFERERRFSGDLAHELRTPIAELRSLAEVALKWPEARPGETDREALAIALQLDGIVSRLLSLLRSERGELLVERRSIDLGAEIARACKSVTDRGLSRGLQLTSNVQAGSTAIVDTVLVRSILSNLLDNAVEYASDRSEIQIDATGQGEQFAIRVSNHTGDLRPEDVPNLFDRFWRRSAARSDSSHSGLGLPIARAFAEAMDCKLTASVENGKVTFTLAGGSPRRLLRVLDELQRSVLDEPHARRVVLRFL